MKTLKEFKKLSREQQRSINGGVVWITQQQCIEYCRGEWESTFLCYLPVDSPCAGWYAP